MSDESLFRLRQSPDRFGRWQEDHPVKRLLKRPRFGAASL